MPTTSSAPMSSAKEQDHLLELDMEDELSSKGSTLILSGPFLMTTRTKIDMHARTLSMDLRDKSGAKNLVVDHLSKIEGRIDPLPIRDNFPNKQLMQLNGIVPWFDNIASRSHKGKIKSDAKNYVWDDPYLWKFYSDQCIPDDKIQSVLQFCHSIPIVGIMDHTRQLEVGFIGPPFSTMPTISSPPMSSSKEQEWPLYAILFCEAFDVLGIDFTGLVCQKLLSMTRGVISAIRPCPPCSRKYEVVHRVATTYHPYRDLSRDGADKKS
ncbi:hypothetical protein CR513_45902, partial [Mucuna pruriens]